MAMQDHEILRASFLPVVSKCAGALHGEGVVVQEDAGAITAGGVAVHEICQEIIATGRRPEDLTSWIEKHGCEPDFVGRATWYAQEFWREMRGAFPEPRTEISM